ncbi:MAG: alpha/beta fold hydrolase [Sedimenticolaceae bacterium]
MDTGRASGERPTRLTPATVLAAVAALGLIAYALFLLVWANAGVESTRTSIGPTPVTVYRSSGLAAGASAPVVVISHGFAGSQQLMRSFAVTIAGNGYLAVTFDYLGHGRNLQPLGGDVTDVDGSTRFLLAQTRQVVDYALSHPAAGGGLAMLGHSMASDVVVRYAQSDPRVNATIAVSMFSPAVTKTSPRNLLVIVGGLEGFLKQEALRVLGMVTDDPAPGVTYGSFSDGSARRAAFADHVEHVGVLYSSDTMRETVAWLDQVFNRHGSSHIDQRGGAIALLFLGVGILGWPLARLLPTVSRPPRGASLRWRQLWPAGLIPAIATPLLLWWFPADFLSVLVGGYLAVHFGVYGLVTALYLWWLRTRTTTSQAARPAAKTHVWRAVIATLLATGYVAGLVAFLMDHYVTSFAVTAPRVPLIAVMLVGTLSYFLADEWLTRGTDAPRGAHAYTHAWFLLSLGLAVALSFEDLFFLLIIAGIILLYFIVYGLFGAWIYRATGHPAVGAVANAVAFAWALAVVFPMLSG